MRRDSVLEYAYGIPGLAANDVLFTALRSCNDASAARRCEALLTTPDTSDSSHPGRGRMLRRLKTMIKLLGTAQE